MSEKKNLPYTHEGVREARPSTGGRETTGDEGATDQHLSRPSVARFDSSEVLVKKQLSILPLVLLVVTLACTINAPPGAPERNLLAEAPVTSTVATATRQAIPGNTSTPAPTVTPEYRITETRTCEV